MGISQPTISRCVKKISKLITQKLPSFIKFPQTIEESRINQMLFYNIAGIVS